MRSGKETRKTWRPSRRGTPQTAEIFETLNATFLRKWIILCMRHLITKCRIPQFQMKNQKLLRIITPSFCTSYLFRRHNVRVRLEVVVLPTEVALEGVHRVGEDEGGEAGSGTELHVRGLLRAASEQLCSDLLFLKPIWMRSTRRYISLHVRSAISLLCYAGCPIC